MMGSSVGRGYRSKKWSAHISMHTQKERNWKQDKAMNYELSKPASSDVLPPAGPDVLRVP